MWKEGLGTKAERPGSSRYKNKETWFHDDLEKDDIEYNWNSLLRSYKSKFFLFRTYIEKSKILNDLPKLQIFNEDKERLTINDVTNETDVLLLSVCLFSEAHFYRIIFADS